MDSIHLDVQSGHRCLIQLNFKNHLLSTYHFEGSDPGPFCLGRPELYSQFLGQKIVILVFKGHDLHLGFAASEDPTCRQEYLQALTAEEHEFWMSCTVCQFAKP